MLGIVLCFAVRSVTASVARPRLCAAAVPMMCAVAATIVTSLALGLPFFILVHVRGARLARSRPKAAIVSAALALFACDIKFG